MRCQCCNALLDEFEATKTDPETGEYLDTCNTCRGVIYAAMSDTDEEPFRWDVGLESGDLSEIFNNLGIDNNGND